MMHLPVVSHCTVLLLYFDMVLVDGTIIDLVVRVMYQTCSYVECQICTIVMLHRHPARVPIGRLILKCMGTKVLHILFTYEDPYLQTSPRHQDQEPTAQRRYNDILETMAVGTIRMAKKF